MNRNVSLSVFLVMAVIAWWTITNKYSDDSQLQLPESERYVDMYMNEFEMTAIDDSGGPSYVLTGSYLERYNDSDDTQIKQPVFQLLQAKKQWTVSADSAIVNDKDETIELQDNVVMQQQNIEPAVTIRTQNLLIHTRTQIAKTKALVNITRGKSRLNSNGMVLNNVTSELVLSSNVNGYYLPYD